MKELKEISDQQQFLTASADAVEAKGRFELQKALEREEMRVMCSHVDKRLAKAKVDDAALKENIRNACSTAKMLQRMDETKLDKTIGHSSNKYSSHKRIILIHPADEALRRSLSSS